MLHFRSWLPLAVGILLLAGCARNEDYPYAVETDEPSYQRGKSLEKQGRDQEALSEFLKIVAKRSEDAPESHLEVAILYEQHIKDPIAAIYHYRKYLELRPNSPQADLARQHIGACMRDFARTLPGQPLGVEVPQPNLSNMVDKLQKENAELKAELAARSSTAKQPPVLASAEPSTDSPVSPVHRATAEPAVITRAPLEQPAHPTARPASGRVHTVGNGDTLSNISQHYYGTRSKWRDIYTANRDVMKNENDLKIGMELKIP